MYGLYRVATLIFSCTRTRIHQFGGPQMFSHKTSQKTAKLAIFRLRLKLLQNSKNKRKNRLRKQLKRDCQNDQNLGNFRRRFDFHKKGKKTRFSEKLSICIEQEKVGEETCFFSRS